MAFATRTKVFILVTRSPLHIHYLMAQNNFKDLTPEQQRFLQGLRDGDIVASQLHAASAINMGTDFTTFEDFLKARNQPSPQGRDLFLTVERKAFVDALESAASLGCLVFQSCFGFDKPVAEGGQIQLIHKGNMLQGTPGSDSDSNKVVFNTIFKDVKGGRKIQRLTTNLAPLNSEDVLAIGVAREFIRNFRANYPGRTARSKPFSLGFLLPVKALLKIFTGSASEIENTDVSALAATDKLTFQWGLTAPRDGVVLGNFTLAIGIGDPTTGKITSGPVIHFRWTGQTFDMSDCPPNPGCNV